MMKRFKELLIVLLALAVVFAFGAPALAAFGSQGGATGAGGIQVDPNAPGTKYEGPLTIYYVPAEGIGNYNMYFFLRLRKGSTLYAFSGTAPVVDDVGVQQLAIENFFTNTVIPLLYPGEDPPSALKSVDQIVDNFTTGQTCCSGKEFTIMDVVIAVQD